MLIEQEVKTILNVPYARALFVDHKHAVEVAALAHFGSELPSEAFDTFWYVREEVDSSTFKTIHVRQRVSSASGIAGFVVNSGDLVDLEKPQNDSRYNSSSDLDTKGVGMVSIPFTSPFTGTPIGVLQVARPFEGYSF